MAGAPRHIRSAGLRLIISKSGARALKGEVLLSSVGVILPRAPDGKRKKLRMDVGAVGFPHLRTELFDVRVVGHSQRRGTGSSGTRGRRPRQLRA